MHTTIESFPFSVTPRFRDEASDEDRVPLDAIGYGNDESCSLVLLFAVAVAVVAVASFEVSDILFRTSECLHFRYRWIDFFHVQKFQ